MSDATLKHSLPRDSSPETLRDLKKQIKSEIKKIKGAYGASRMFFYFAKFSYLASTCESGKYGYRIREDLSILRVI